MTEKILEIVIKSLVDKPKEVDVEKKIDGRGVLLTVKVGKGDEGAVIGKKGVLIKAIRTIMFAVGAKNKESVHIKLDVPLKETNEEINED